MFFFFCLLFTYVFVMFLCFVVFFFFKQKTAYEMRISDWSSDVCSSDLVVSSSLRSSKASLATLNIGLIPSSLYRCSRSVSEMSVPPTLSFLVDPVGLEPESDEADVKLHVRSDFVFLLLIARMFSFFELTASLLNM